MLSLENFELHQTLMKYLLLLEVKPPRRRPRAPKSVVSLRKVCEGPLHLQKERSKSLVEWEKWLKET
jgi:hypothetical protein